jgi:hypothetical protein
MGRLTPSQREARADPWLGSRIAPARERRAPCMLRLGAAAEAAYYTGRSCYFRPLFERPRQWAAQRSPRPIASVEK